MAKRAYDNKFPSVTTLISQLSSYGLMEWFKRTPYEEIIRESSRGKEIGTQMHQVIMEYITTGNAKIETEYPEEITMALNSFMLFRKEHPEYVLVGAEKPLTSIKHSFNGTIDAIGNDFVYDWKSGKCGIKEKPPIWTEAKIQVSAYCHLINEVEGTNFNKALIVSIAKDKMSYDTYLMEKEEIDGYFNEEFIPLIKIWRHRNSKRVKEIHETNITKGARNEDGHEQGERSNS